LQRQAAEDLGRFALKHAIIAVSVFIIIIFAWHGQSFADVNGDVTLQLGMFPIDTQTESVEFNVDFEVLSNVNWTVSGVTFGSRLALGVTGLEHSIMTLEGHVGPFHILSESVFATPFSNNIPDDIDLDGIVNASDPDIDDDGTPNLEDLTPFGNFQAMIKPDIDSDLVENNIDPDIDGDGFLNAVDLTPYGNNFVITPFISPIGPTVFVKKRFTTTLNLGGFQITNLSIFEDINFTHPFPAEVQSYSATSQNFRFGNIITIVGQTVSGINLRSVTGMGADPDIPNLIKKASFKGSVCPGNTNIPAAEQNFTFCVEQLFIDNIHIGSLELHSRSEFRITPLTMAETLTLKHGFFRDSVNVSMSLTSDNLITFAPMSTSIFLSTAPFMLDVAFDPTFAISSATATLAVNVDGSEVSATAVYLPATGINSMNFRLQSVSITGLSVFASMVLSDPGGAPNGGFGTQKTTFSLKGNITPNFGVDATISFTNIGITNVSSRLSYQF
jgi:hypothetical protein